MKRFFASAPGILVLATLATIAASFVVGAVTVVLYNRDPSAYSATAPDSLLAGGMSTLLTFLVVNPLFLLAAGVRFFAYKRFEAKRGRSRVFTVIVVVAELAWAAIALSILWVAAEPQVDAGFAFIAIYPVSIVVILASIALWGFAIGAGPKSNPTPEPAPATLL